jgi:hypothetical protein
VFTIGKTGPAPARATPSHARAPQDGYQLAEASRLCGDLHSCAPRDKSTRLVSAKLVWCYIGLLKQERKIWFAAMSERNYGAKGQGEGVPSPD